MSEYTNLVVKDENKRLVEGWASVEVVDRQGEIVPIDTLKSAFMDYMSNGGIIMYMHQNKPVGKVLNWSVEDVNEVPGIRIIAELNKSGVLAEDTWNQIKLGGLTGFSIGGRKLEREQRFDKSGNSVEILRKIDLNEISIVGEPANQMARIEAVSLSKGEKNLSDSTNTILERTDIKEDETEKAMIDFLKAEYPFDECLKDQEKRYGSREKAEKVCGAIKARFGKAYDDEHLETDVNADKSDDEEDDAEKMLKFVILGKYYDPIEKAFLWDKCIEAQMDRYHDMKDAERVCGAIRQKIMREKGKGYTDHNSETHKANYDYTGKKLPGDMKTITDTHIKQSDGDKVSENPINKNVSVNNSNMITSSMSNNKDAKKGQLVSVGDKNMNDDFETESDGLSKKPETEKATLASQIEEEEHRKEKMKEDKEDSHKAEGSEGSEGSSSLEEKVDGLERLLRELVGKLDRKEEMKAALGEDGRGEEEDERNESEETEKANYKYNIKHLDNEEPEPKVDGRRKGGVGIEQVPSGTDLTKGVKKYSTPTPSSVIGQGRNYMADSSDIAKSASTYQGALTQVLKGAKVKEIYNARRGKQ